jgi:hypothetical protein
MDVGMAEAGQFCDEPLHREKKKDALIRTFGIDHGLWGSAPCRWTWTMMDQDATRAGWTISRARGSLVRLVWHV